MNNQELESWLAEQAKKKFKYDKPNYIAYIALILSILALLK